jgi:putative ABC transport system permease protein
MGHIFDELRASFRSLRRNPGFSLAVIITLGLGIGANSAIFSVINGVLLRDLPFPNPDRLVQIRTIFRGEIQDNSSEANVLDYREQIKSLESVGAYSYARVHFTDDRGGRRILIARATHDLMPTIGIDPLIGRIFSEEEDQPGAELVVVLSHGFWQQSFGGRPDVLGETIKVQGLPVTVIGVMPPAYEFPHREVEAWIPRQIDPSFPYLRANHNVRVVGRLKNGFELEDARSELEAYGRRAAEEYPQNYKTFAFGVTGVLLHDRIVGDSRTPLLVLLGAVAFVLLIACANVASLLLARAETRSRDFAVRFALGASRGRITTQMLSESLILSLGGGVVGLLIAHLGTRALLVLAADVIPRLEEVGLDLRVAFFTFAVSVFSGLLAGFLPAHKLFTSHVQSGLRDAGRSVSPGRRRTRARRILIAAEVAMAVMLVICAGVMIRTLRELTKIDLGFRTDEVLVISMSLPEAEYEEPASVKSFYSDLEDRVSALPGVASVGLSNRVPLASGFGRWSIQVEGEVVETIGEAPVTHLQRVSPGFVKTLGVTLKEGRGLTETDTGGQPLVGMVNEAFVRRILSGRKAVGRRVRMFNEGSPWMEIVGVVRDVKHEGLQSDPYPMLFVPYEQSRENNINVAHNMGLFVHAPYDAAALAAPIRDLVRRVDPSVAVYSVQTMDDVRAQAASDREFPTILLGLFGSVALILSALGIYAMVSYSVSQRTREVGVRMALGAGIRDVRWMVVRQAIFPVAAGVGFGLLGALHVTDYLGSLLYNVSTTDPLTYGAVAASLAAVALLSAYLPALRASRVDPMTVLRNE